MVRGSFLFFRTNIRPPFTFEWRDRGPHREKVEETVRNPGVARVRPNHVTRSRSGKPGEKGGLW